MKHPSASAQTEFREERAGPEVDLSELEPLRW